MRPALVAIAIWIQHVTHHLHTTVGYLELDTSRGRSGRGSDLWNAIAILVRQQTAYLTLSAEHLTFPLVTRGFRTELVDSINPLSAASHTAVINATRSRSHSSSILAREVAIRHVRSALLSVKPCLTRIISALAAYKTREIGWPNQVSGKDSPP